MLSWAGAVPLGWPGRESFALLVALAAATRQPNVGLLIAITPGHDGLPVRKAVRFPGRHGGSGGIDSALRTST